jgi:pimeloyl-ACP methyl ester carboxylesterase
MAHQRFRATLEDAVEDFGLSAHEYGILSVFETRAELSTSELARVAQVTRQTMHPAICTLESARRLLAQGLWSAEVARAPDSLIEVLRLSARRPGNARTVASLMRAIDRFRRPRAESVLTVGELAAIRVPTTFILGSDDPYLSPRDARPSIARIPNATVHELRAGHGPWLVDPGRVAGLIAAHHETAGAGKDTHLGGRTVR